MSDLRPLPGPSPPVLGPIEEPDTSHEPSALVKWISIAMLALGSMYLAVKAAGRITDPDTWWHLRLGEEFRNGWSLSNPGQLSPLAHSSWLPTEWLPEVVASGITDAFGLRGLAWLTGAGVLALAGALFAACRREGNSLAASLAVMAALAGISASIAPRPQLVSFVLLAVYMGAWLRTARDLRPRWWLVPLSGIWACSHGMWLTGILTGLAVVLGLVLDGRLASKQALRLLLVPVLGVCAAAVTPVGPKLLLAPLTSSRLAPYVTEWQPPNFREPYAFVTALMLMAIVMTWSRGSRTNWSHILLLVLAFGWTALSGRTVALGAVMAAPLLSAALHRWMRARPVLPMVRRERLAVVIGLAMGLLLLTLLAPIRASPDPQMSPEVETALAGLPDGTVVFNEYTLGGWLEWQHRNVAPVIDGMAAPYGPTYLARYEEAMRLGPGWQTFVRGTGARYALLYRTSPLALELQTFLRWRPLARGPSTVLLVQPGA